VTARPLSTNARLGATCWLAEHGVHESGSMPPCDGALVKAHLIPKRLLKGVWKKVHHDRYHTFTELPFDFVRTYKSREKFIWDPAGWVWACGGIVGNAGHHGMLDSSRTLKVPRMELPPDTELFAANVGLAWYLDHEFGAFLPTTPSASL
jgi:hypothetical protein